MVSERENTEELEEGTVLEGPFWPEKIIFKSKKEMKDKMMQINGVGEKTKEYYERVLTKEQLAQIKKADLKINFSGNQNKTFLALCAMMIKFAYQFNPLYAINYSEIRPLPHQIDAVYNYILKQPQIRFLLADDPGAGKTIMAGLVIKELKERGVIKRILIVVPGHLREQWQTELHEKFNEDFFYVNRDFATSKNWKYIWGEEPQIITSLDFAKQEDIRESLNDAQWDLIVVDEAHKMAAHQTGSDVKKTARYRLGETLSERSESLLFLTATPHSGKEDDFRLFLNLLVPGLFLNNRIVQEYMQNKDGVLYLRRIKEKLVDMDGAHIFPDRAVKTVAYDLSAYEKNLYNAVTEYVKTTYNKALRKDNRNNAVAFALLILQRRLASSLRAISISLGRRKGKLESLRKLGKAFSEGRKVEEMDFDEFEDLPEKERWEREEELEQLTTAETLGVLEEEIRKLGELIEMAKQAEKNEKIETKLRELKEQILPNIKTEKLLIFTESKDTLDYLVEKIRSWGHTVTHIDGSMPHESKKEAEREFKERAQIMVSTEAGGEGINLQFCHFMVNYDIPWNPNRLEQRMGRIHRYGQKYPVSIYNLVAKDTIEGKIFTILFEKLESMRKALGNDRVFDVLGEVLPGSKLQQLIVEALTKNESSVVDLNRSIATLNIDSQIKEKLDLALKEASVLPPISPEKAQDQMQASEETKLEPEYAEDFFVRACEELGYNGVKKTKEGFLSIPVEVYKSLIPGSRGTIAFSAPIKATFDKKIYEESGGTFLTPSSKEVRSLVDTILEQSVLEVKKGAVFTDVHRNLEGLLWFLRGQVNYGDNKIAEKRIIAIYQNLKIKAQPIEISPTVLWDLAPSETKEAEIIGKPELDEITQFAIDKAITPHLNRLKKEAERIANIREKYGMQSLEAAIQKSQDRITQYNARRTAGGNIPEAVIYNEKERLDGFKRDKERLVKNISAIRNLSISPPEFLGVIFVNSKGTVSNADNNVAEQIGLDLAIKFEKHKGRIPEDLSLQKLGYDIRSISADNQETRYIEVKTRSSRGQKITMTANEWLKARRFREKYWLYIVAVGEGTKRELYTVQDPATVLKPTEDLGVVSYIIGDWKDSAVLEST